METKSYEIKATDGDEVLAHVSGRMSLGATITYAEENFDVDTNVIAIDYDGTHEVVATVRVQRSHGIPLCGLCGGRTEGKVLPPVMHGLRVGFCECSRRAEVK